MPRHRSAPRWRLLLAGLLPLGLGACQAMFFHAVNAVTPDAGIRARRGIVFEPAQHLRLDVYAPRDTAAGAAPVVVFFYGGAWQDGKRQWYRWVGETLARQGLVAVVPDYRKYPGVRLDGFMHDAAHAVAWTRAHAADFGGDPRQLFLMGHSAGAHIGALLATDPHWLASVGMSRDELAGFIGLAGPYDFLPLRQRVYRDLFGTSHAQQERSQPVHFIDGGEPPMLLLQGDADTTVAPHNATSMAAALRRHHDRVQLHLYPGVNHAWLLLSLSRRFRGHAPALADSLQFIDAHDGRDRRRPLAGALAVPY